MNVIKFLEDNWSAILSAPLVFVICIVIGFLIGKWYFSGRIDTMKIWIQQKDDLLDEYRQRLKMIPIDETGSKYTRMTHDELKRAGLELAGKVRELIVEDQRKSHTLSMAQRAQMMNAKSQEERNQAWEKFTNQLMSRSYETRDKYDKRFKVDAILLRDEMLSRLPESAKNKSAYSLYEHPTNPIGMGMVADDLERLAKSLEVKKGR
jgi:hypothetical protein